VPGLRRALAERWREMNAAWPGRAFGEWAAAAEAGNALRPDGEVVWHAMVRTNWEQAFRRDERRNSCLK
jgi:hypothetical protein